MGYLKFQNYVFEGESSNLKKLQEYFSCRFSDCECFGCSLEEGLENILKVHVASREYYASEFSEIASRHDVKIYYSCGSEMGGRDTNDCDEKYFKWKPENIHSYGFRKLEVVIIERDGTEKRKEITGRRYWTVSSAKDYCRSFGRNVQVFFCLSEAFADFRHDEIDGLVKSRASIYEIYSKCSEFLEWLDDQYPEWFYVSNDKDKKYFDLNKKPFVFVESETHRAENKPDVKSDVSDSDSSDFPF